MWPAPPHHRESQISGPHAPRHQRLSSTLWKRCRAALARRGIEYFGFGVVEPHHDGTPHWHLLLFVNPAQQHELISTMQRYALSHDLDDLERKRHPVSKRPYSDITPRFDWKVMDQRRRGRGLHRQIHRKQHRRSPNWDEGDLKRQKPPPVKARGASGRGPPFGGYGSFNSWAGRL
ncbi:replication endonuclease [Aeromonas molluscorum]|uniref:replication endonuclease n=1 Tax=Aeromonas molluscorum TaxID=271417 RepID=UPI003F1CBBF7